MKRGPKSHTKDSLRPRATEPPSAEHSIPLRGRRKKFLAHINRPLGTRNPGGYDLVFLDSYKPNLTAYLDLRTRIELGNMGSPTAGPHPAGTYAKRVLQRILIDLSWNWSRIEGNTYSLLATRRLIQLGEAVEERELPETQMILNHKEAIHCLVVGVDEIGFNWYTICPLSSRTTCWPTRQPQADSGKYQSSSKGRPSTRWKCRNSLRNGLTGLSARRRTSATRSSRVSS